MNFIDIGNERSEIKRTCLHDNNVTYDEQSKVATKSVKVSLIGSHSSNITNKNSYKLIFN